MLSSLSHVSLSVVCALVLLTSWTEGHGRLLEPPSRSSMWRFNFNTPVNYDDNQLSCGGYQVQWGENGGRCGVCGDPYNGARENEAGGRYATGTITRHYIEGQTIPVTVEVTTNHGGYFEFRICPNNDSSRPVTQACLDQHLLRLPSGETKWLLPTGTHKFTLNLVLPRGLTCTQCVLQWKWNTASNWDCDDNNNCCKGCGHQEQFYGCSDVAISSVTSGFHDNIGINPGVMSGSNIVVSQDLNIGVNANGLISGQTGTTCRATVQYRSVYMFADRWCQTQCPIGNCPVQYCEYSCRQ